MLHGTVTYLTGEPSMAKSKKAVTKAPRALSAKKSSALAMDTDLWEAFEDFQIGLDYLKGYKVAHGDCSVVPRFKTEGGFRLGTWCISQRTDYKKGQLSQERIDALEALGFIWDPLAADMLSQIQAYVKTEEEMGQYRTTTLSTRLSVEQKQLIDEAAQLQSWTPSKLIRKAAVERSAHIVNTGRPTRFAFGMLAERLASQLCDPELWHDHGNGPEIIQWEITDDHGDTVHVPKLAVHEFMRLEEALHLGGLEFMDQVVEACRKRLVPDELPEPINPDTLI